MSFFEELKRRRVIRMAALYIAAAYVVLEAAGMFIDLLGLPENIGPVLFTLLVIGFPIALVLSWFYAITAEGVSRESESDSQSVEDGFRNRKFDVFVISILAAAVLMFAYDKWWKTIPAESIAVLCFDELGTAAENRFFAEGLSDQIRILLGKLHGLTVTAKHSSCAVMDGSTQVEEIGSKLNVAFVLGGSATMAGGNTRVAIQLSDTGTGYALWEESWNRDVTNVFRIQDEIASAVVESLRLELLGQMPTARRADPEAYDLFLRSLQERMGDNVPLLQEAVRIDPEFSQAWGALASTRANQLFWNRLDPAKVSEDLRRYATKALELDPENLDALWSLAAVAVYYDRNYAAATTELRRALDVHPNGIGLLQLSGSVREIFGRLDDAVQIYERAIELDPLDTIIRTNLFHLLIDIGDFDGAERIADEMLLLEPDLAEKWPGWPAILGRLALGKGNPNEVLQYAGDVFQEADHPQKEYWRVLAACAYADLGRIDESDRIIAMLEELIERSGNDRNIGFPNRVIAMIYACRGDADNTFLWINRSIDAGESTIINVRRVMDFRQFEDDPRWDEVLERLNVTDEDAERALGER